MYFKSLKSYSKEAKECIDESLKKLQHHADGEEEEENSHNLSLKDLSKRFFSYIFLLLFSYIISSRIESS